MGWKYSSTAAERLTISVSRVKMRGSDCGSSDLVEAPAADVRDHPQQALVDAAAEARPSTR